MDDNLKVKEWESDDIIIQLAKAGVREDLKQLLQIDYKLTTNESIKEAQRLLAAHKTRPLDGTVSAKIYVYELYTLYFLTLVLNYITVVISSRPVITSSMQGF